MRAIRSDHPRMQDVKRLSLTEPRCPGKTAGPQGLQWAGKCGMCHRRLSTNPAGVPEMVPPAEEPCPKWVPFQMEAS